MTRHARPPASIISPPRSHHCKPSASCSCGGRFCSN
jgi:hypothetical protein